MENIKITIKSIKNNKTRTAKQKVENKNVSLQHELKKNLKELEKKCTQNRLKIKYWL